MANIDIRGNFQNNRRREAHAVTCAVPFVLESADLREGKKQTELANGDYTVLTLPAGVIVTGANLIVEDDAVFDGAGSKLGFKIGGVEAVASTAVDAAGLTKGTAASFPLLITTEQDVVATAVVAGTGTTGTAKLVLEYVDYNRATMSYIGAE